MNCPLTTRILLGQTNVNLPAMVDIAELYYQAAGRKAEKERERENLLIALHAVSTYLASGKGS